MIESTLSGLTLQGALDRFREAGYTITILFVFLDDPAICIARIQERVLRGGHDVPAGDVRRRYFRAKRNFWNLYRNYADLWHIFYNGAERFQHVAFGAGENYTVVDEALFELFLRDIQNQTSRRC